MSRGAMRAGQRRRRQRDHARRARRACRLETLEPRQMLAVSVVQPMGEQWAWEDGHDTLIDLRTVFESDLDQSLAYELVDNTNETLADASLEAWALRVRHSTNQFGSAEITVRARGQTDQAAALDTLFLTTRPVNDPPVLLAGLPEITVHEGSAATLDLTPYFQDIEEAAKELTYSAKAFDASDPGNPVQAAYVENGILSLTLTADVYGYAEYAIAATDREHAGVSATLYVYVEPVNDPPVAQQMPDRYHCLRAPLASPIVIDLWYQYLYDGASAPYFHDVEDGSYLTYSVSVDRPEVFQTVPYVDAHSFLLYRPTSAAEFHGSAVVTITARDREGVVARLADGSLPTFRVHVDNPPADPGIGGTGDAAGDAAGGSGPALAVGSVGSPIAVEFGTTDLEPTPDPTDPGTGLPGTGGSGADDPPGDDPPDPDPPDPDPPSHPVVAAVDLEVLSPPVSEDDEQSPGAWVALNNNFDEHNVGTTTILVGPNQREVEVLSTLPDNQPDRIWEQGRQHHIAVSWQWWWDHLSDRPWRAWGDNDVRPARAVVTGPGSVQFEVPEGLRLWIPAWALYGGGAFTYNNRAWELGTRWIEVRPGDRYRIEDPEIVGIFAAMGNVLPLAIEGLESVVGDIVARYTPTGAQTSVEDTVHVTVVSVDLDIDSDNTNQLQPPERSAEEERLEDQRRDVGKRLVVNADDTDCDNVPDFLDGFNLDEHVAFTGQPASADDQVALAEHVGFVPVVVELPMHIDPSQALLRFAYMASDPGAATIAEDGARQPVSGGLRLWTVDESTPRNPSPADDPAGPGHFIAPYSSSQHGGVDPNRVDGTYTVGQLTGDPAARQFTIYLEGVQAGQYTIDIKVDADGLPSLSNEVYGPLMADQPNYFLGLALRDTVRVTVESEVTVSAVNAVGAESDDVQSADAVQFEVSRGRFDTASTLAVFFRLHTAESGAAAATDPTVDPSRSDYHVTRQNSVYVSGLADDPYTQIGWVWIPTGNCSATLTIVAENDSVVEWDESVAMELIEWDEYRRLHDQIVDVTPNDGVPWHGYPYTPATNRSLYRLKVDAQQQVVEHVAVGTLLDNDALTSRVAQRPDAETVAEEVATISHGLLAVGLHDGDAQVVLPIWGPTYRENDNLRALVEIVLQLPACDTPISRLTGLYTIAGRAGETVEFDVAGLQSYLDANPLRDLRLVVVGPASLSEMLATGHYDDDVVLTAYVDDQTLTRTVRGSLEVINRVHDDLGSNEFGNRWWLDELDRVVPGDEITSHGPTAASRLGPLGARTQSGIALVRGDNSSTWFGASQVVPGTVVNISDTEDGQVTFSDPADWVGDAGEGGVGYRTSAAGLQDREAYVAWHFTSVQPDHLYQVYVHWDADPQLASNAVYEVLGGQSVAGGAGTTAVDQRFVPGEYQAQGRAWRSLGFFTTSSDDNELEVRLCTLVESGHFADGLVSAGAVMLVDQWEFSSPSTSASQLEVDPVTGAVQLTTKTDDQYQFAATTGVLEWQRDRNGNHTEYSYMDADDDGRADELCRLVRQGGLATTFRYAAGKLITITDSAGRGTQWLIDEDLVQTVVATAPGFGALTPRYSFVYTADSLVTQVKDPRGYSARIDRDVPTRRVSHVTNPDRYGWSIRPYLADGSNGELRLPSHGQIGARSIDIAELTEARATYVDPRGNVWEYQTDSHGLLTAEAKPAVPGSPRQDVWRWVRDERGLPLCTIEPPGGGGDTPLPAITTRQVYDAAGDLLKRVFADGTYEQWTYDRVLHQVRSYRDRLGRRTGYALDTCGNVTLQVEFGTPSDGTPDRRTRYTYSAAPESMDSLPGGLLTRVVVAADSADAVTTEKEYYTTGRQVGLLQAIRTAVGVADPDVAAITWFTYNDRRNLTSQMDAMGHVTSFVYDNLDRLVKQQDPSPGTGDHLPPVTLYYYDAVGNVTLTIDPRGVRTLQTFDALNRLTGIILAAPGGHTATDQAQPTTKYRYDTDGNLIWEIDPLNRTTDYVYDARGQNISIKRSGPNPITLPVPPESLTGQAVTSFDYDTLGDLRSVTDARGATTRYAYDAWHRMIRETSPAPGTGQHAAPVTECVYDAAGQLLEVRASSVNPWRVTNYAYDGLGRLSSEIQPTDMAGRRPTTYYTYDLRDNVLTETQPNGLVVVHQYDELDRLCRTALPDADGAGPLGQQVTGRDYNVDGTLRGESQWNTQDPTMVLVTSYGYDQLGRTTWVGQSDPDGFGPLLAPETTYHYDVMGNQTVASQRFDQDQVLVHTTLYDNLNRPWKIIESVSERAVREDIHIYDRAGQVIRRLEASAEGAAAAAYRQSDYAYDALGRLVMQADPIPAADAARPVTYFYYDTVGNLRFERDAAGCWTEYEFDALRRLVTVIEPAPEDLAAPVTRFAYTITGDLQSMWDPLGRRTDFVYDNFGREVLRRLPSIDGQVPEVRTDYDVMGNVTWTRDNNGNSTRTVYDVLSRPVAATENGVTCTYTYDALGRLASETDGAGRETRYGYDQLGRRTVVEPPHPAGRAPIDQTQDDETATFVGDWQVASGGFEAAHHVVAGDPTAAANASWSFAGLIAGATYEVLATWDADAGNAAAVAYRISDVGGPLGAVIVVNQQQIAADVMDRQRAWQRLAVVTVADAALSVQLEPSSVTGRVVADGVRVVEMFGTTYTTYDLAGNVVSQTDGLGNTTRYTYDEQSHQTSVTDANGDTTRFVYDPLGRLTAVVDPLGNETSYRYDDLDRMTQECVHWEGTAYATSYQYDVRGNVQCIIDRLGRVRTFRYDAQGRLREEIWYETTGDAVVDQDRANTIERQYDLIGRLTAVRDDSSDYTFAYDTLDREVSVLADLPGIPAVLLTSDYVRHDELRCSVTAWVGDEQDFETRFLYDVQGRLQRLEQTGPGVSDKRINFSYTSTNQLARLDRFEDLLGAQRVVTSLYKYDGQGRVTGLNHLYGRSRLAGYQWGFDPAGRVTRFVSLQDGTADYRYDARGQLLSADYADQPDESYAYDANGNRVTDSTVVGQRNQLESDGTFRYEYDAQGNRIKRTDMTTGAVTEFRWDLLNRLVEIIERTSDGGSVVNSISYAYDAFGRRVEKTVAPAVGPIETECYVYDGQNIALRFVQGRLANRYLHGPIMDQILADEQIDAEAGSSTVLWPLADNLGTVRDIVDYDAASPSAQVANHIVYDAFGNVIDETAAAVDHIFGFTGREDDEESDLNYYRARYYDPGMGQYVSEDPSGFSAGDANLYRYVQNSPTNKVDPTGCYDEDVHFYFNYYLARYLGLNQPSGWINSRGQPMSEALIIAYFATRVDFDAQTEPVISLQARRIYHVPDPNDGLGVRERDRRVQGAIRAVADAGDVEMFGILLHVFQDSFSHHGYGDVWGHLWAEGGVHSPDEPHRDPAREQRMARAAYEHMVRLLVARRGIAEDDTQAMSTLLGGRSFNNFWNSVAPTLLAPPTTNNATAFASNRVAAWQGLIARDFRGATPRFNDRTKDALTPMARWFRRVAAEVPVWYSSDYNHHAHWGNWHAVPRQPSTWSTIADSLRSSWMARGTYPQRPGHQQTRPTEWRNEWPQTYGGLKW